MIIEKVNDYMQTQIKQWPVNSNRASEIGHPCERYLFFNRTRWQERALHTIDLEYIFREGREQERSVLRLLADSGVDVLEQQRPFSWPIHQITGSIDGKVLIDGQAIPLEIKSMHPFIWQKINSLDDMLNAKQDHLRKYPAQLTIYMLCDNKDKALFLFKNKSTGQLKEILINLDYEYAESIIRKVERVNKAVETGITPDPLPWCDTCEKCPYRHICINDAIRTEMQFWDDEEAEEKITRWMELKPVAAEYDELDTWRKDTFRGVEKAIVGNYLVMGKEQGSDKKKTWKVSITSIQQETT